MAYAGDRLINPLRGEEFTFLKTSEETQGQEICLFVLARPGFPPPPLHKHPKQTESLMIESGYMCVSLEGKKVILGPGEYYQIPPNTAHAWYNAQPDQELRFTLQLSPALDSEKWLETMFSLAFQGKANKNGKLPWLQEAVISQRYQNLVQQESSALGDKQWLKKLGAPIGRLLGYKPYVPYPDRF
ncbi:MAG: cupin domain-containing protein [Bacteroidota bacterium]